MTKYIAQPTGGFVALDEASDTYTQLMALPKARRPVFLSGTSAEVKAHFAALESAGQRDVENQNLKADALKILSGVGLTPEHIKALGLATA